MADMFNVLGNQFSGGRLGLGLNPNQRQRATFRAAQNDPTGMAGMGLPGRARRALAAGRQPMPTLQQVGSLVQSGMLSNVARRRNGAPSQPPPAVPVPPPAYQGLGRQFTQNWVNQHPDWYSNPEAAAQLNAMINQSRYGTENPTEAQQIAGNPDIAAATGQQPQPAVNSDVAQVAAFHPGVVQPFDPNNLVAQARQAQYDNPAARQAAIQGAQLAERPVQAARRQMRQNIGAAQGPLARSQARIAGMQAMQNARYNDPNSAYNEQMARRQVPRAMRGRMAAY
jgi:hypothetical protein